jgi:hypothetical protein
MNIGVKAGLPGLYAAAVLIGFLINTRAGVIIAIGGAVVVSALYTIISRTSATPESSRRPPRNRNRGR